MKVLLEGYGYQIPHFDRPRESQTLYFINEVAEEDGSLALVQDGVSNEEVLKVLINRLYYLQGLFPCRENAIVITKLEESLMWLNKCTEDRKDRNVKGRAKV